MIGIAVPLQSVKGIFSSWVKMSRGLCKLISFDMKRRNCMNEGSILICGGWKSVRHRLSLSSSLSPSLRILVNVQYFKEFHQWNNSHCWEMREMSHYILLTHWLSGFLIYAVRSVMVVPSSKCVNNFNSTEIRNLTNYDFGWHWILKGGNLFNLE